MVNFRAKVGTGNGEIAIKEAVGSSTVEIKRKLAEEGYFVFDVKRVWSLGDLNLVGKRVSSRQFNLFNREFRGLVKAGMPIAESLRMVLERMPQGPLRALVGQVLDRVVQGEPLSAAFKGFEGLIPSYYPALLFAGEQSGHLPDVLEQFIDQESRLQNMRRKFRNALTYPAFLMIVGIVALYVILGRAMPQFAGLYRDSQQDLPIVTEWVMALGDLVSRHGTLMALGFVLLAVAVALFSRTAWGKRKLDLWLWRIPFLGSLWRLQNQNAFAWTMNMLITGGIPVPQALSITARSAASPILADHIEAAQAAVERGSSLESAIDTHLPFESLVADMVRIGESTGTLDEMFAYIAENGEEHASDKLEMISNVIAPFILLLVGLTIAALVIAMYLPMFGVADLISGD
ncbi:MAG: type II secretion system F family protein [Acidobacteria bacterium]|nr:type II secretion system F family protein [Acidobacteriota bacterium]